MTHLVWLFFTLSFLLGVYITNRFTRWRIRHKMFLKSEVQQMMREAFKEGHNTASATPIAWTSNRAIYMDSWMEKRYKQLRKEHKNNLKLGLVCLLLLFYSTMQAQPLLGYYNYVNKDLTADSYKSESLILRNDNIFHWGKVDDCCIYGGEGHYESSGDTLYLHFDSALTNKWYAMQVNVQHVFKWPVDLLLISRHSGFFDTDCKCILRRRVANGVIHHQKP